MLQKNIYFPQLDILRALAVLLVIISHWFSDKHILNAHTYNNINGVSLFFVLSGFLITNILIKSKENDNDSAIFPRLKVLKYFYIRRSLRIFPIYYILLLVVFLFGVADIRESFWWHFFYSSNFYFWLQGEFSGSLSHLWSLSVEEQFYLIWPLVILFVSERYIYPVFIIGILFAVLFRSLVMSENYEMARYLLPGNLDSFCIGGVFALGREKHHKWYAKYMKYQWCYLFLAFIFVLFIHILSFYDISFALKINIYILFISFAFAILINRLTYDIQIPLLKTIIENKKLIFLGKISYSLYLFHNLIPFIYDVQFPYVPEPYTLYLAQLIRFMLLLLLSILSWYIVEKPFLKLKERFII